MPAVRGEMRARAGAAFPTHLLLDHGQLGAVVEGHAGGIVPTVLQALQAADQQLQRLASATADVADVGRAVREVAYRRPARGTAPCRHTSVTGPVSSTAWQALTCKR